MIIDELILEELKKSGAGTVQDIQERISRHVSKALERLVAAEKVIKDGFPGKGNQKTYSLPKSAPIRLPPAS
jgi:hypothetical protein